MAGYIRTFTNCLNHNMESTRQQKIARLIQKEIADLFQEEGSLYGNRGLITVTRASVSRDMSYARINVSVFGVPDKAAVMALLEANSREIRFRLGQRVRMQLRVIPELTFVLDETLDYIENIDKLLKQ